MSVIVELFCHSTDTSENWLEIVQKQHCLYLQGKCYKVRKSDPTISIGTCTVLYGRSPAPVTVCPARFLERRQVFIDCFHLLTSHEPGNELHIVPEVMAREFNFQHVHRPAVLGDSMHMHAYSLNKQPDRNLRLALASRVSTDAEGVGTCLGLQAEARVELEQIIQSLQGRLSQMTLFNPL